LFNRDVIPKFHLAYDPHRSTTKF